MDSNIRLEEDESVSLDPGTLLQNAETREASKEVVGYSSHVSTPAMVNISLMIAEQNSPPN